jgi:serine phosphatase RsbU (regulator of sigma subunit)
MREESNSLLPQAGTETLSGAEGSKRQNKNAFFFARTATAGVPPPSIGQRELIENLLKLQKAAKKINSTLDMAELIDSVVNDIPGGKWGLALADVSGKGMAAALLMSATRSIFRAVAENVESPGEVLARINRSLLRDFPVGRFVTMIYGVLDPVLRTFTFANAGHPWPVISGGTCTRLIETETGIPLGIADASFSESTVTLNEGARVLFYSDGISESLNDQQQEFGSARLSSLVGQPDISTAEILDAVRDFSAGQPQFDDATVVLISARR